MMPSQKKQTTFHKQIWFYLLLLILSFYSLKADPRLHPQWSARLRQSDFMARYPYEQTQPIVWGDLIYVGTSEGNVYALNKDMQKPYWGPIKLPHKEANINGALTYARSKLFVGDVKGHIYALASRDGSVVGHTFAQGKWLSPPVLVHNPKTDEMMVIAMLNSDEVFAYSENLEKELWHHNRPQSNQKMTIQGSSTPVIYEDKNGDDIDIVVGFSDGYLSVLDIDGREKWTKNLRVHDKFYDIDATPYVDENIIIAATYDGRIYCLDRLTGNIRWIFPVGSYGGFLIDKKEIIFSGLNNSIYGLNFDTGDPIWHVEYKEGVGLTPLLLGDKIIIPTTSDPIYVLERDTHKIIDTYYLGSGTLANMAINEEDGSLYVLSNYGVISKLMLKTYSSFHDFFLLDSVIKKVFDP